MKADTEGESSLTLQGPPLPSIKTIWFAATFEFLEESLESEDLFPLL